MDICPHCGAHKSVPTKNVLKKQAIREFLNVVRPTPFFRAGKNDKECCICCTAYDKKTQKVILPCCLNTMCRVCATTCFTRDSRCPFCRKSISATLSDL